MQRVDELRIVRDKDNLSATRNVGIVHRNLTAAALQCGKPWHRGAVNRSWIGIVAPSKCRGLLAKMRPHESDLLPVTVGNEDGLRPTVSGRCEDMLGKGHREGHHAFALLLDIRAVGGLVRKRRRPQKKSNHAEDYGFTSHE